MKTIYLTAIALLLTLSLLLLGFSIFAQSIEREVVASSGDYYEGANISLSWTLGEIATETYDNGSNILTQGFQQPDITVRIYIDLDAFLEGPFNGSDMDVTLNYEGLLPLSQPFNTPPWNYMGTESVSAIPNPEIVDWLLVELRDAVDPPSATPTTKIAQQAAFIRSDGKVVGIDGFSNLEFNKTISNQLFVVLWHRNHLGMMSAFALTEAGGVYDYNFITAMGMAYLNGQKSLNGSAYGMYSGDADSDGEVEFKDLESYWRVQAGELGYFAGDFDMNTQVNNMDKNDYWHPNKTTLSQVPQ